MKNKELISIVVPIYNVDKYLDNCLTSLIKQTYENIEIILVDDGSIDNSAYICDTWLLKDSRIRVIHKKNGGLSDARNAGIRIAKGVYITFVDGDDSVDTDMIEYLYLLQKKYSVDISICSHTIVTDDKKCVNLGERYSEKIMGVEEALDRMLCEAGYSVSVCGKLFKRELFNHVKFPVDKLCEDNGTTYKLFDQVTSLAYGPKGKYYYYKRENSIMTSSFNLKKMDLIILVDEMVEYLEVKYPGLHNSLEKKQISSRFSILRQILFSQYFKSSYTDDIIKYIKSKRKVIFSNPKIDIRDRCAYITLMFGKHFFKLSWSFYNKIRY